MTLTDPDLRKIAQTLEGVTEPRFVQLGERLGGVESRLDHLTTSVDEFLTIVRRHEEEWLVLRAQHQKMRDLLIKKGFATEDELALA